MAGSARVVNTPAQAFATQGTTHTQLTISSSAVNLLAATPSELTKSVLVQFNGADARVTFDGTTPTSSLGFLYTNGSTAYLSRKQAIAAKCIRAGGTDVVAEIQQLDYLI